jgi:lysozyme family protein
MSKPSSYDNFKLAMQEIWADEGLYSNIKEDAGGATMYGVTEAVARASGWQGRMQDLPHEKAERIALTQYWVAPGFDLISIIDYPVAARLFNAGYLCGTGTVSRWLQRALNACNNKGKLYDDVKVDGVLGPKTRQALGDFLRHRGDSRVLVRTINGLFLNRLMEITEAREDNETFFYGWVDKRVD